MANDETTTPQPPDLRFVMRLRVEVAAPLELGETLGVSRRIVPITGGSFEGPSIRGEVLPGGADWQFTRPDGVVVLEARYTIRTVEGDLITVVNRGFRHGPPGLAARPASGEQVRPSEYYFVTAPLFETTSSRLQWLARTIFVGQAERERRCVRIDVWQLGGTDLP